MIEGFDHVNVRTTRLDEMIAWYGAVLDMRPGKRPNFPFPGAWLYLGDHALVHVVAVDDAAEPENLQLEHFALRATGLAEFLAKLETRGERVEIAEVPGFGITQVNIWDPDGNHIHVDFHGES